MSYPEKKSLVNLISSFMIFALYAWYVVSQYQESGTVLSQGVVFWVRAFFVLIPVSIVASIIISIVFSIVHSLISREKEPQKRDEFDKLIDLKATQASHWAMVFGVLIAVGTLGFGMPVEGMLIVLSCLLMLSSALHDIVSFVLYRRGI